MTKLNLPKREDREALRPYEPHLAQINPRWRVVMETRYGLGTSDPHTYEEIANMLGISRGRVRQICLQAWHKLQYLRAIRELEEAASKAGVLEEKMEHPGRNVRTTRIS